MGQRESCRNFPEKEERERREKIFLKIIQKNAQYV
jgi:hypothetical protein